MLIVPITFARVDLDSDLFCHTTLKISSSEEFDTPLAAKNPKRSNSLHPDETSHSRSSVTVPPNFVVGHRKGSESILQSNGPPSSYPTS